MIEGEEAEEVKLIVKFSFKSLKPSTLQLKLTKTAG